MPLIVVMGEIDEEKKVSCMPKESSQLRNIQGGKMTNIFQREGHFKGCPVWL